MSSIQISSLHSHLQFENPKSPNRKQFPLSINHRSKQLNISSKWNLLQKNRLVEGVVISGIGACILLGSFSWNAKPSLALAAEASEDEVIYEKLLEEGPKNVKALKMLIYGKMRKGKNKEALNYVVKLINIEPQEIEWRLLEALCYEMMGQFSKAKRLYKGILEENPLLLRALHGLAMVMHKSNEGPAMFDMLNKALEMARHEKRVTEERNIKILIAQMHVVKGQLEEGLKNYQDLIEENPRDFRPYLCQGIIYSLMDKKKEADEQFETYKSLVPEEFPQRGFLDDLVFEAKAVTQHHFSKEFDSYKK